MIITAEDIIQQQQQQQQNFEQLCERVRHLDIRQQTDGNFQQHYSTVSSIEPISTQQIKLPSINELLIKRIKELEINLKLQNQEIENLKKENTELNEKFSLLIQAGVNIQVDSKFNYLKQEFNNYKEELNEKFFKYINDMKVVNFNNNNQDDRMIFDDISNTFESNNLINLQRNNNSFNADNNNNFENVHRELRNIANEINNDRDSLTEKMNSLRNMYNQYNY